MIWPFSHFARRALAHQAPAAVSEVTITLDGDDPAQVARMAEAAVQLGDVTPGPGDFADRPAGRRVFGGLV